MDTFETLLEKERAPIERFVKFKIPSTVDADDVLQDVLLAAYQGFSKLKNLEKFKAWILGIAKHKCNDYFRRRASQYEIPIERLTEYELAPARYGISTVQTVRETLYLLGEKDKQILYLYYWKEMPLSEIAKRLQIPLGTVKSRLYTAKKNFKKNYPYQTDIMKGEHTMKRLPELIPAYKIEESTEAPFAVKWEELMGWFLIPKLGEKCSWGIYDIPSRKCSHVYDMKVTGKAKVHGVEGVAITSKETACSDPNKTAVWTYIAQLTDTHCRMLAEIYMKNGVQTYLTFLDGDDFLAGWGYGDNNCGKETDVVPTGRIAVSGGKIVAENATRLFDIVGRYTVTIAGVAYDTVRVLSLDSYNGEYVACEQYLDCNGRTILWRRFNRDDWATDRFGGKPWSEQLPENERLFINGETYVHWYDCITDYIL